MTEAEWLECPDPTAMLKVFEGKVSERKARLFAVACCRTVWACLDDERFQTAVEIAEKYADGTVSEHKRREAFELVMAAGDSENQLPDHFSGLILTPAKLVVALAVRNGNELLSDFGGRCLAMKGLATSDTMSRLIEAWRAAETGQILSNQVTNGGTFKRLWQSIRFRFHEFRSEFTGRCSFAQEQAFIAVERDRRGMAVDIFGNPFCPVAVDPSWLTSTVLALARGIYNEKAFDRMPILADALQDAGCEHDDILNHCRDEKQVHVRGCWVVDHVLGKS